VQLSVSTPSSNLVLIRFIVLEILRFLYFAVLAWNCGFTPILGGFGAYFPQIWSPIVLTPKRTILGRKHVVSAIKRENRSSGLTCAQDREKKGKDSQKKSQGGNISPIWGEAPHCTDWNQNLLGGSSRRRNHICKVSRWYFQGLRFYRGSNFPFFLLILHGPYNSAARLRCLW